MSILNLPIETLLRSESTPMMLLDATRGVVLEVSPATTHLIHLPVERIKGEHVQDALGNPGVWKQLLDARRASEAGEQLPLLVDSLTLDGRELHVEMHPIWIEEEGNTFIFLILHDVTSRLIMEDSLDQERSKWQALLEHSSDLTMLIDQDLSILYASPSVAEHVGKDSNHLINQSLFEFMHPDDAALFTRYLDRIRTKDDATMSLDCRIYHHESEWFWVNLTVANKLSMPSLQGFVLNGQNIHEQQLILRETQRYGRLLEISQELSNMGSWEWNLKTNEVYWSDQVYAIYGMEQNASTKIDYALYQSHIHEDDRSFVREIVEQAIARKEPFEHYHRTSSQSGEVSFVYGYGVPELDESGNVVRYIGISNDVTQMRHMELQLKSFTQSLKLNRHALEQFVSVASHDLKEPARKIRTFSDTLIRKYEEQMPEGASRHIRRIHSAAQRMEKLIEALLRYSQVNGSEITHQYVDLNHILDEVKEDLELRINEKNAHIDVHMLPTIEGDPTRLRQLFQNLISNALKFTSKERPPHIQLHARLICGLNDERTHSPPLEHGSHVEICIKDNGVGFKSSMAKEIFEPFKRAHGRSAFQGTGIGLAICQTIVKQHHGKLEAHGEVNKGATFKITLPCQVVIESDTYPLNKAAHTNCPHDS